MRWSFLSKWLLAGLFAVCSATLTLSQSHLQKLDAPDQARMERILQAFYNAWERHDQNAMTRLWSSQSPNRTARLAEMAESSVQPHWQYQSPKFVSAHEWSGQIEVETTAIVIITGRPEGQSLQWTISRKFLFCKEAGQWLILNSPRIVDDFAEILLLADSETQTRLLGAKPSQLSVDLGSRLLEKAEQLDGSRQYQPALSAYRLAERVAVLSSDVHLQGRVFLNIGEMLRVQGELAQAKQSFEQALQLFKQEGDHRLAGETLDDLGQMDLFSSDPSGALKRYEEGLKEFQATQDLMAMSLLLEKIGNLRYDAGLYATSAEAYEQILFLLADATSGSVWSNLGNARSALKRYDAALEAYQKALPLLEDQGDTNGLAELHSNWAAVFFQQRQWSRALEHYQKSLQQYEARADKADMAQVLEAMGHAYFEIGQPDIALDTFRKSLELHQQLTTIAGIVGVTGSMGNIFLQQQKFEEALQCYQSVLRRFQERGEQRGILVSLQNVARVYDAMGDYPAALDAYEKAVKLAEETSDAQALSNSLLGLGVVKTRLGEFAEALELFGRGLKIASSVENKSATSAMLHNIGLVFASQSDYSRALDYYQRSLELSEDLQDQAGITRTLGNLGLAFNSSGRTDKAIECHQRMLRLDQELNNVEETARAFSYLGGDYFVQKQYDAALEHFQKSLERWQELQHPAGTAAVLSYVGDTYFRKGEPDKALENYQKSLAIQEVLQNSEAAAALHAGISKTQLALGQSEAALASARSAATLAEQTNNREILWNARFQEGLALLKRKEIDTARKAFQAAILTIEQLRHQAGLSERPFRFFDGKSAPYEVLAELLIEEKNFEKALDMAERAKHQQLQEALGGWTARIYKGLAGEEIVAERQSQRLVLAGMARLGQMKTQGMRDSQKVQKLEVQLAQILKEYDQFEEGLEEKNPELARFRGRLKPLSLRELAGFQRHNSALLLEYVITGGHCHLFAISSQRRKSPTSSASPALAPRVQHFTLDVALEELEGLVTDFSVLVMDPRSDYCASGRKLFDLLLGPVRQQLAGCSRVLIVPDKFLWMVPFAALQPEEGRCLLDTLALAHAPSLTTAVLAESRIHPAAVPSGRLKRLLLFADPGIDLTTQPPEEKDAKLVPSLAELNSWEHWIGDSALFSGQSAQKERFKTEGRGSQTVVLALPGRVQDAAPLFSQWRFYVPPEKSKNEGLLETWEFFDLELNNTLMAFTRSERPWNMMRSGEGLMALHWALLVAGCTAEAVSRWSPNPLAMESQLLRFLGDRRLRASGAQATSPAEGLRQAALALRNSQDFSHPSYWAGFYLLGAGF
jgi:tetratricopeptide (TPR) repeat protein